MATGRTLAHWKKDSGIIAAGSTVDFACSSFADFRMVKYIVNVYSDSQMRHGVFEMTARKDNTDVSDQLTSRSKINLNVSLNILKDGTDVVLRIVNDEIFDVDVSLFKLL